MQPIKFKSQNIVFAEDQDQYLSLPAHRTEDGVVTSCWGMTWKERLRVLLTGKVYTQLLTFNTPLTPHAVYTEDPVGRITYE